MVWDIPIQNILDTTLPHSRDQNSINPTLCLFIWFIPCEASSNQRNISEFYIFNELIKFIHLSFPLWLSMNTLSLAWIPNTIEIPNTHHLELLEDALEDFNSAYNFLQFTRWVHINQSNLECSNFPLPF